MSPSAPFVFKSTRRERATFSFFLSMTLARTLLLRKNVKMKSLVGLCPLLIPGNNGCIVRTCVASAIKLNLIEVNHYGPRVRIHQHLISMLSVAAVEDLECNWVIICGLHSIALDYKFYATALCLWRLFSFNPFPCGIPNWEDTIHGGFS